MSNVNYKYNRWIFISDALIPFTENVGIVLKLLLRQLALRCIIKANCLKLNVRVKATLTFRLEKFEL